MAAGDRTPARRVGSLGEVTEPGDYALSEVEIQGQRFPCVWFLLPIAKDEHVPDPGARAMHHVRQPPHRFRLCDDGSVEIRESIGAGKPGGPYYWHGYLDEGNVWREV